MLPEVNNIYRFEDFELHTGRRTLSRFGEKIPLAPKTFEVLVCLVTHAGHVLSKQDVIKTVWPESFVEESNLTQHIFWLRKAFGDKSPCIVTIPGRGYMFTAPVETLDTEKVTPPSQVLLADPTGITSVTPVQLLHSRNAYRPTYWAFIGIFVVLAVLIGWGARHRLHGAVPGDHHEVVLADFENTTGNADFDRTLKTLLTIDLNQSPYLLVASDSSVRKVLKLMNRSADGDITAPVAREVCERLNDQVILAGLIARFGQKYLVTLTATDCSDGKDLVQTKAVASNREDVIKAVDTVAAEMRERLGEPLKSLHRRGQPLLLAHTFSLDALKAYSQARALHVKLKYAAAVPLYKHAIELDSSFADAWAQLANCYNNMGEAELGKDSMAKAYALRDQADEPARLRITAMYEYWKTGDRHAAIRTYESWAALYPNQTNPWVLLGQFQLSVGRTDLAVQALKRAVALDAGSTSAATSLAEAQRYNGQVDDAKATCLAALSRGLDGVELHRSLLEVAFLQRDKLAFQQQMAWFHDNASEEDRETVQADVDVAEGKYHSAVAHYLHLAGLEQTDGLNEAALERFVGVPQEEAEAGLVDDARQHFKRYAAFTHLIDPSLATVVITAAELHQFDVAQKYLKFMLDNGQQDSDIQEIFAPEGQAAIDIAQDKPEQAIAALQRTAPFELSDPSVPDMRGRAFLAAHQLDAAQREFRTIIDRPYTSAISPNVPLAHLGLARTLALQGNPSASRQEYETMFEIWKDADPTLPVLKRARQEYAHLK